MRKLALWFSSSLCVAAILCGCGPGNGSGSGSTPKAPTANVGGPYTGKTETALSFSGNGSSDPQGEALTYAWNFGDKTTGTGVSPSHTYTAPGTYTVSLTVTDTSNLTATASTTATVAAQPPVANAGGPYTGGIGAVIYFSGNGSSDPQGETLAYAWNFGDGTTGTGISPSHAYTAGGTYTVSLTVTDTSNLTATASTTATIAGLSPAANAGGPYTGGIGTIISFSGSKSNDPRGETLTYAWNFGDGTTGTGVSPTHAYTALGTYTVSLTVTDTSNLTATASTTVSIKASTININGLVSGGKSPISGATIALYAAGNVSNGSTATAVPTFLAPVVTDSNGNFDITSDYTCVNASDQMYLVATGGSPDSASSANNAALELMAALGPCDQLSSTPFVTLNEVTTVASAWALSQFLSPGGNVGATPNNVQGLANAVITANNLVNIATGASPGAAVPANVKVSTSKLNMLANALASCVNSVGGADCSSLLAAATAGGVTPSNTLDAALNIARNPASNVGSIYTLATANTVFQSALAAAPPDWMLYATLTGGGLDGNQVAAIAVDSGGNVWVSTYFNYIAKFSPNGTPATATGFTGSGINESYGIALDASDDVWITNRETSPNSGSGDVTELNSSGQPLTGANGITVGGIDYPVAVATDTNGNVWIADNDHSHVTLLNSAGTAISPSTGFGVGYVSLPLSIAVDANHNAWVGNSGGSPTITRISSDGSQVVNLVCCDEEIVGIAIDQTNNLWTVNYDNNSISQIKDISTTTPSIGGSFKGGGGLDFPSGIAVDGAGNVWVTNFHGASPSLTELAGSNAASPGTFLSPTTGFGSDASMQEPYGVAVDASGNLWVSNTGNDSVTELIGAAVPVRTPLVGPVQLP
ncbi:PKD domain-containing protein [Granulicella sp. S156]|uniref:PKD domain-containing protein n=1 Tax=Granulicella sp. S156 TaxID=1747224 RepID=UPI00131D151B|nr:PKD domain-containing protein [Granulicella sp. S156]